MENIVSGSGSNSVPENPMLELPAALADKVVNPMLAKRLFDDNAGGNNVIIGTSIGISPPPPAAVGGAASAFAPISTGPPPAVATSLFRQPSLEATMSTIADDIPPTPTATAPVPLPVPVPAAPQMKSSEPVIVVDLAADSSPSRNSIPGNSRDCPPSASRKRKATTSAAPVEDYNMNTDSLDQSLDAKRFSNKLESPTPDKGKFIVFVNIISVLV